MDAVSSLSNSASVIERLRSFGEGAREARDHAVIGGEAPAGVGPRIAAGQRDDAHHPLVLDQRHIEVGNFRQRHLEHHLAAGRQGVEPLGQFVEQDPLGARLVGALDRNLRLEDRHEPMAGDLFAELELLPRDRGDAGLRGEIDDRAHLGAEHAELHRPREQLVEVGHRLHQADAVLLRLEPFVDLDDRHDAPLLPQVGRNRLALRLAVHGALEQDGGDDPVAGEGGRGDDAHPHFMHELEHLGVVAFVFAVRNPVEAQGAGRRSAALVERGDEAGLASTSAPSSGRWPWR